jgi:uncharacterized protein (TIGR02147 family)
MKIYDFLSYREWLEHWYTEKKKENSKWSYRMIARLCQQKSPSFLKDIIQGRRNLTAEHIQKLSKFMELDQMGIGYLSDLVTFEDSKNRELRQDAFIRINALRRVHGATRIEGDSYAYLSTWYCPVIRELSFRSDFAPNSNWISKHILPKITEEQASNGLSILQNLGMLTINHDGSYVVQDGTLVTPYQVKGLAVHNYHHQMLQLAQESLDRFTEEERHVMGLTVCVPKNMLRDLKQELNSMASRLLDMCDSEQETAEIAVQLGLYCFPVSESSSMV